MKIFVTNMPAAHERRKHILSQLEGKNLDFEFADCVVGKDLTEEDVERECDIEEIGRFRKDGWFNKGIIGCTMTSRNIHREIMARDLPYAMLLEDDAVLPWNFKKILDNCEAVIKPGDVILLFWLSWVPVVFDISTVIDIASTKLYEAPLDNAITGGTATIFSREAAGRMAEFNTPIRRTPDCWRDFYEAGCFKRILCAFPQVVDTADLMSTMEHGRFIGLRKFIDQNKIFPFYQFLRYKRRSVKQRRMDVTVA